VLTHTWATELGWDAEIVERVMFHDEAHRSGNDWSEQARPVTPPGAIAVTQPAAMAAIVGVKTVHRPKRASLPDGVVLAREIPDTHGRRG
jgi:hypothetical protein